MLSRHKREKASAETIYKSIGDVFCPYFGKPVIFNSDGFHHLQFSAGRERDKKEQMLKFSLLTAAPKIIQNSGTIQQYRKTMEPIGQRRFSDGALEMKQIEYWGLVAITGEKNPIRIKVILRRVGTGNIIFWSVMPDQKLGVDAYLKLASLNIQEE